MKKLIEDLEKRSPHSLLIKTTYEGDCHFQETQKVQRVGIPEDLDWDSYISTVDPEVRKKDYTIRDFAIRKGAGTGSIGLYRFVALVGEKVLELKEARIPIPAYFLKDHPHFWDSLWHQGKRMVVTQHAMLHLPDAYLGYTNLGRAELMVRERSPWKKNVNIQKINNLPQFVQVLKTMGKITAKIHARAGFRVAKLILPYSSEKLILEQIGNDLDSFIRYVQDVALAYAVRVERDFELFCNHIVET